MIYVYIYCFHWKNRNEKKNDIEISNRKGTKKGKKDRAKSTNCKHLISITRFIDRTSNLRKVNRKINRKTRFDIYIYCFHWNSRTFDRNETKNNIEISNRKGIRRKEERKEDS